MDMNGGGQFYTRLICLYNTDKSPRTQTEVNADIEKMETEGWLCVGIVNGMHAMLNKPKEVVVARHA